jgi:hypothetical protein
MVERWEWFERGEPQKEGMQGSADVWSLHFLERIANAPPVLSHPMIAALFTLNRLLGGYQLGLVSM